MSHFKITSPLSAGDTSYREIYFIGCDAHIIGSTTTCYFVKFYAGLPFMIGKNKFQAASTPHEKTTLEKGMIVADVTLKLKGEEKKTFRTVLSPDDTNYESVKKNALQWFKMSEGVHYDSIVHEQITDLQTTTKKERRMTKKTEKQETGLAVFESEARKIMFPEIPKVMEIGGVTFSADLIRKEVEEVKKLKIEIINPDDTVEVAEAKKKVYEELVEKRKQLVKTRTAPENFRKDVVSPLNKWMKDLKSQTDEYGKIAKEGEDHCAEQIEIWDNYEAEQERLRLEELQKKIDARIADLQSVGGILNRESLHWTFDHNPAKIVENPTLEDADDSEWNGLMAELEASLKKQKEEQAKKEEEFAAAKNAVYNARLQMIQLLGGYEQNLAGGYTKNGHLLTDDQIRNTPDADWMPLLTSHSTPKVVDNPFSQTSENTNAVPPYESPVVANPFAVFEQPSTQPEAEAYVPHTIWDVPFVEKGLGKTKIRLFPIENEAIAKEGIGEVVFDGKWDVNLMFVIYK